MVDEGHEHDWQLDEVHVTTRGADRGVSCWCGATSYVPGQAALRDTRPPLDGAGATA